VRNRPGVTAPVIGARTVEQLVTNLGSLDWELTAAQTERLTVASDQALPYPYNIVTADPERR
jgi:aryl-alcohol dehydrogenase-like predicted oxidoreductase